MARTDDFQALAKEIALQIAATRPLFVSREDVPESVLENERGILKAQALNEGKPEKIAEKIVEGRIEKFYKEVCLLEQPYIRDSERTVQDLVMEVSACLLYTSYPSARNAAILSGRSVERVCGART